MGRDFKFFFYTIKLFLVHCLCLAPKYVAIVIAFMNDKFTVTVIKHTCQFVLLYKIMCNYLFINVNGKIVL